jgi:hypothetical protein
MSSMNSSNSKTYNNMRTYGFLCIFALAFFACSKKSGNGSGGGVTPTPPVQPEENIAFAIDPDPGAAVAAALSGTYSFKVNVSSKLTTSGVKVDITTKKDSDNSVIESKQVSSTTPGIDISTGTLSPGVLCNVTVVVTSAKTSTNTATKTFKVARK